MEPPPRACANCSVALEPLRFAPGYEGYASPARFANLDRFVRMEIRTLQRQWLLSPETVGWAGGVHAPVRMTEMVLLRAARVSLPPGPHTVALPTPCTLPRRTAESVPHHRLPRALADGLHFVTMLREPLSRFLSEFYELYAAGPHTVHSHTVCTRLPQVHC